MDSIQLPARKAILFSLDPALAVELGSALRAINCKPVATSTNEPAGDADVVFCASGATLYAARQAYPQLPAVVVSRLPEAEEWIEVLEAGACDYAAAPFEPIQMRWVLDALPVPASRRAMRAAAAA